MDLGSESVGDDDNINYVKPEPVSHGLVDDGDEASIEIRNNGSCANGIGNVAETRANHLQDPADSAGQSPGGESSRATKVKLKRWKRIPRNQGSIGGGNLVDDSSRKRGMSGNDIPVRAQNTSVEVEHNNSEGSVGSVNMRNVGVGDGFPFGASPDSRFPVGINFAARADSENSEDRTSKSSTAASAPKGRYDLPLARERNRVKNASTKSWNNSAQSAQPGKGKSERSKKQRGDRVKIEMENFHSSMESDSRSSNFVFMQAAPLSSNGRQSRRSMSQEGENSVEAHANEQQFSEEVQTGYRQENAEEDEDYIQDNVDVDFTWEDKGKKKKHGSFADMDPLAESMFNLETVQDALQKEVQKFGEIGKEPISQVDDSVKLVFPSSSDPIVESNLSDPLGFEKIGQTSSCSLEAEVLTLKQQVKLMEDNLGESRVRLEVKESRVAELEDIINHSKSREENSGSTIELKEEQYRELETEVETLFRQKIEAEVEYIVVKRTTQIMKIAAGDQIALIEKQESVVGKQAQMLNKIGEQQIRATKVKEKTEELGKYYGDIIGTEDIFSMQKRICKVSSCFFMQLILLLLAVWIFLLQSSPPQGMVVPT